MADDAVQRAADALHRYGQEHGGIHCPQSYTKPLWREWYREVARIVLDAALAPSTDDSQPPRPTQEMLDAAVDAYVAEMDPELRGGLIPNAVRRGMWPALVAVLKIERRG